MKYSGQNFIPGELFLSCPGLFRSVPCHWNGSCLVIFTPSITSIFSTWFVLIIFILIFFWRDKHNRIGRFMQKNGKWLKKWCVRAASASTQSIYMTRGLKIPMSQGLCINAINVEVFSGMTPEKRFSGCRSSVKQDGLIAACATRKF